MYYEEKQDLKKQNRRDFYALEKRLVDVEARLAQVEEIVRPFSNLRLSDSVPSVTVPAIVKKRQI